MNFRVRIGLDLTMSPRVPPGACIHKPNTLMPSLAVVTAVAYLYCGKLLPTEELLLVGCRTPRQSLCISNTNLQDTTRGAKVRKRKCRVQSVGNLGSSHPLTPIRKFKIPVPRGILPPGLLGLGRGMEIFSGRYQNQRRTSQLYCL